MSPSDGNAALAGCVPKSVAIADEAMFTGRCCHAAPVSCGALTMIACAIASASSVGETAASAATGAASGVRTPISDTSNNEERLRRDMCISSANWGEPVACRVASTWSGGG